MAGRLDGKVALISGAARGQGEAEARMFVAEGAKVVLGDILLEDQQKVVDSLGGQATGVKLDVTQEADWQSAVDTALNTYGKLDILVNNAGIFPTERLEETGSGTVEPGHCYQPDGCVSGHEIRRSSHASV